ncbi:hypothetical protein [Saccharicrinis sp. GN24d3]|uniref:hypothetical protein n=1 Tax=Saccharicrinis sp. GN24d3 TaxID=3458416 RepID=UPI004036A942
MKTLNRTKIERPEIKINWKARYIKIKAKSVGQCPDWHPGKGGKAWLFAEEIVIK